MNPRIVPAILAALVVAAGIGYWAGRSAPQEQAAPDDRGRVLYYRNPMGAPDTSPVPKKDSMGMAYIPVYEREVPQSPGAITVDTARLQRAGVRTGPVLRRTLRREITAVGVVKLDEARIAVASPRVEGWIERVHVGATGVHVAVGQPLIDIYSPEIMQTQEEYFLARAAAAGDEEGLSALADGALRKLRNLGLSEAQVRDIAGAAAPRRTLTLTAPLAGVVREKNAVVGQRFMPGDVLYRIADLGAVWVVAKVPERDLSAVTLGAQIAITVAALGEQQFEGPISFVAPALDPDTRTADVRIAVANPDGALRADMFAAVKIDLPAAQEALTVPNSAIIDSGTRQVVLVAKDGGRFEPREVKTGLRADTHTAVLEGLGENDQVVVDAAFLIDSESNLKAALQAFTSDAREQRP